MGRVNALGYRNGFPFPTKRASAWDGSTFGPSGNPSASADKDEPVFGDYTEHPLGFSFQDAVRIAWRIKSFQFDLNATIGSFAASYSYAGGPSSGLGGDPAIPAFTVDLSALTFDGADPIPFSSNARSEPEIVGKWGLNAIIPVASTPGNLTASIQPSNTPPASGGSTPGQQYQVTYTTGPGGATQTGPLVTDSYGGLGNLDGVIEGTGWGSSCGIGADMGGDWLQNADGSLFYPRLVLSFGITSFANETLPNADSSQPASPVVNVIYRTSLKTASQPSIPIDFTDDIDELDFPVGGLTLKFTGYGGAGYGGKYNVGYAFYQWDGLTLPLGDPQGDSPDSITLDMTIKEYWTYSGKYYSVTGQRIA